MHILSLLIPKFYLLIYLFIFIYKKLIQVDKKLIEVKVYHIKTIII